MSQDQETNFGALDKSIEQALAQFRSENILKRIWNKEVTLWKEDAHHQKVIQNRLGWLNSVDWLIEKADDLASFQTEIKKAGFTHAVLLGMGGSSLAPEVFRATFGKAAGFPKFSVLDSTDPDQILKTEKSINLAKTLFIVSSKSGTTLETASFYKYFYNKLKGLKGDAAGKNFIAITDPGTLMSKEAEQLSFFRTFINPADIGGRFSVLSYFGMVPAAVMGIPVKKLIERIHTEVEVSRNEEVTLAHPGLALGLAMGTGALKGRDKLTIIMSPKIESYGLWVEQMVAESLGKEGKGVVPVYGEKLSGPDAYEQDRLFVYLGCGSKESKIESALKKLEAAGFPVIRVQLKDQFDLGRQFFRWAFATAVAGIQIGVNPFDEPNVQEAKDWTKKFLDELKTNGRFLDRKFTYKDNFLDITLGNPIPGGAKGKTLLSQFLKFTKEGDYFNLGAYLPYESKTEKVFQNIRLQLGTKTRKPTMFGFGPRYLHSTGQLHKGGPNSCVMILVTTDSVGNAQIPGEFFGFRELEYAQALGDFYALVSKGRRAIHIHLNKPLSKSLLHLEKIFKTAISEL